MHYQQSEINEVLDAVKISVKSVDEVTYKFSNNMGQLTNRHTEDSKTGGQEG